MRSIKRGILSSLTVLALTTFSANATKYTQTISFDNNIATQDESTQKIQEIRESLFLQLSPVTEPYNALKTTEVIFNPIRYSTNFASEGKDFIVQTRTLVKNVPSFFANINLKDWYVVKIEIIWGESNNASAGDASFQLLGCTDLLVNNGNDRLSLEQFLNGNQTELAVFNNKKEDESTIIKFTQPFHHFGFYRIDEKNNNFHIKQINVTWDTEPPTGEPEKQVVDVHSDSDFFDIPWVNNPDGIRFDYVSVSDDSNSLDLNDALTVSLSPMFEDPIQIPTEKPASMIDEEWETLKLLEEQKIKYDGYFDSEKLDVSFIPEDDSQFILHTPCSGKYKLTITSNSDNIVLNHNDLTSSSLEFEINLYPSIKNIYKVNVPDETDGKSTETTLTTAINSRQLDGQQELKYPLVQEDWDENPHLWGEYQNAKLFIPGLYNATVQFRPVWTDRAQDYSLLAASDYLTYSHDEGIDLTDLATKNLQIQLSVTKNGASTPQSETYGPEEVINVSLSDVTTSINAPINHEFEQPVVYYNLNGQRISPDNLQKGIYIKRRGGKAEKVIF